MKGLDWFEARTLARNASAVRRDAWRKWLTFESYVWLITQPAWETQIYDRRVVQQWDFGADEFLAHDWTDEPWPDGPQPPDPPNPPQVPNPPGTPGGGGGGGGGGGNGGDGTGTGWPSGGGGGGPQPPVPPKEPKPHQPPQPDTPTVSVEIEVDIDPDGPECFIQAPQHCTAYVNVSIAGGPAGVGSLSVKLQGQTKLSTAFPGFNGAFEFPNVLVNPGGTITATADYGAPGNVPLTHYIGNGSHKFEPRCILFKKTWTGSMTESQRCKHDATSGGTEDGYDYAADYTVNGQYAVNPEGGSGKTAELTTADVNEGDPHIHWTNDTVPDGTHTEGDIPFYPPDSVTADVSGGAVSNISPDSLNAFGDSQNNKTSDPECTFNRQVNED